MTLITNYLAHGSGTPTVAPTIPATETALYYDDAADLLYIWKPGATAWHIAGGAAPADATTTAPGLVEVDHAPSGAHPVALTTDSTAMPSTLLGTTSTKAAAGNDARLSDARTPTAHETTHLPNGSDALPWTTILGSGNDASKPTAAAGNVGELWFATDTKKVYQSAGATTGWVLILDASGAGGGSGLPAGATSYRVVTYSAAGADVALGGTASAVTTNGSNAASHVNDNSDATLWQAGNGNANTWLQIDLGSAQAIGSCRVLQQGSGHSGDYKLQCSDDASTWTDVANRVSPALDDSFTFTNATHRYWRIINVAGIPAWWGVYTFSLFGAPAAEWDYPSTIPVNRTVTANTTVTDTDGTILMGTSALTVTLPSAVGRQGRRFTVKNKDGITGTTVAVVTSGGNVENASTVSVPNALQSLTLESDGSNWWAVIPSSIASGGSAGADSTAFHNAGDSFAGNATLGTNDGFDLVVETASTERARILSTGEVNIGLEATRGQGIYLASTWDPARTNGLIMAGSIDGVSWELLGRGAVYAPPGGQALRDPSIMRYKDQYWLCYDLNSGSGVSTFGVATSPDLATWTHLTDPSMSAITGIQHLWAPEWFVDSDGSVHVFFCANTSASDAIGGFVFYETHPTNTAMTTWSTPVAVTGTSFPTSMIDPFVHKIGSTYYLWYKNNPAGAETIEVATSSSLTSGYTILHSGNWAGWGTSNEAPCLVKVDSSTWRIYFYNYATSTVGLYYSESTDTFATWTTKQLIRTPYALDHGTFLRVRDLATERNILGASLTSRRATGALGLMTRVYRNAALNQANGTNAVAWDSKDATNTFGLDAPTWSSSSNQTRVTIQKDGIYMVTAVVWIGSGGSAGWRDIQIWKNGANQGRAGGYNTDTSDRAVSIAMPLVLVAGDYIEAGFENGSGASIALQVGTGSTWMSVVGIG